MAALIIHRDNHLNAVAHAGLIVICTETGSGMDTTGTGIHRDIVSQEETGGLGQEGMGGQHVFKEGSGMALQNFIAVKAADSHNTGNQRLCHDIDFPVGSLDESILLIRMESNGKVARKGPDGGGPDQEEDLGEIHVGELALIIMHGELYINGGAGIVMILNLRLRKGCLILGTPVDRLKTLVDVAVAIHFAENTHFIRFKTLVHGFVGMIPVAQYTETFETFPLNADIFFGIGLAGAAELRHTHSLVVELLFLDDGGFNGHAMVVPPGNIRRPVAAHSVGADNKIL